MPIQEDYERRLSHCQSKEELYRVAGAIALSMIDMLESNWTIGLQMKRLKQAVYEIEYKYPTEGASAGRGGETA